MKHAFVSSKSAASDSTIVDGPKWNAEHVPESGDYAVSDITGLTDALTAKQDALGFTAENVANKDTDGTLTANSDTKYASQKAIRTAIVASLTTAEAYTDSAVAVETSRAQTAEAAITSTLAGKQATLVPFNSAGNGGFFSNGLLNLFSQEIATVAASSVCTAAFTVSVNQFSLVDTFLLSRCSIAGLTALGNVAQVLTAAGNASGGSTIYTGTFAKGASSAFAGMSFVIAGFTNAGNNGTFVCTASSATQITLTNSGGIAETHAGTATATSSKFALGIFDSSGVLQCFAQFSGTVTASSVSQSVTFSPVTLARGVYYMAQWTDNPIIQVLQLASSSYAQIFGQQMVTAGGYAREGVTSATYTPGTGFSAMGSISANGIGPTTCYWEAA